MFGREVDLKNKVIVNGQEYLLSTVSFEWEGSLAHRICGYNYETMLFPCKNEIVEYGKDLYCQRFNDKNEAEKHHAELLERLVKGEKFWEEC